MYLLHNTMLYSQILLQKQTSSTKYNNLKLMVNTQPVCTDYTWRFNTRSVETEQNKNAMALSGLHEVSWWCQSSPQWTLFIRMEKQTPPHSTNWHPCCHCQQPGQGYTSDRKRVFQGHCWGTIGKRYGREWAQCHGQFSSLTSPRPAPNNISLTRSLHTSYPTHANICMSQTPSGTDPKPLQGTEEVSTWHFFQLKNIACVKPVKSKTPRKVPI